MSWIEAMARYSYVYGLKPMGPHRSLADRLFHPMRATCVRCNGQPIARWPDGTRWACPHCEGTGGVWTRPQEEVDAALRAILAAYPDAGSSTRSTANFAPAFPDLVPRPPQPAGPVARRKPKLRVWLADVPQAFADAERVLGPDRVWRIKGRGHEPRVTLDRVVSRSAVLGGARSWEVFSPSGALGRRRIWPRAVVEKAAEILGVKPEALISREWR